MSDNSSKFGVVKTIPPLTERDSLLNLMGSATDFHRSLWALLTREQYKKIARTTTFENFMQDLSEAERTVGMRLPRTRIEHKEPEVFVRSSSPAPQKGSDPM